MSRCPTSGVTSKGSLDGGSGLQIFKAVIKSCRCAHPWSTIASLSRHLLHASHSQVCPFWFTVSSDPWCNFEVRPQHLVKRSCHWIVKRLCVLDLLNAPYVCSDDFIAIVTIYVWYGRENSPPNHFSRQFQYYKDCLHSTIFFFFADWSRHCISFTGIRKDGKRGFVLFLLLVIPTRCSLLQTTLASDTTLQTYETDSANCSKERYVLLVLHEKSTTDWWHGSRVLFRASRNVFLLLFPRLDLLDWRF